MLLLGDDNTSFYSGNVNMSNFKRECREEMNMIVKT